MWRSPKTFNAPFLFGITFAFLAGIHTLSLVNPYYLDDFILLRDNAWLAGSPPPGGWFTRFFLDSFETFPGFRPVLMWSFWLNAKVLGVHAWGFRVVNILLHLANGYLLLRFLRQASSSTEERPYAILASLLFLAHPIQTIGINFLWKRSELLLFFWILCSLNLHARERRKPAYSIHGIVTQTLLVLLAVLTKESGVILPFLLLGFDVIYSGLKKLFAKPNIALYLCLGGIVTGFVWFRFGYVDTWLGENRRFLVTHDQLSGVPYSLFSLTLIPRYLGLWLLPAPRIVDDPALTFTPAALALGIGTLIALLILFIRVRSRKLRFMVLFVVLSLLVPMAPVSLFFAMDQIRLYMPLAGLSYLLIYGLDRLLRRTRLQLRFIAPIIFLSYTAHTAGQHLRYQEPTAVWQDVVEAYPKSDVAWGELGAALQGAEDFQGATLAFMSAAKLNPKRTAYLVRAFYNMYLNGQSLANVKPVLMRLDPDQVAVPDVIHLANMMRELGESDRAMRLYVNALSRNPRFGPTHLQLAYLLESMGKVEKAHEYFVRATELMPTEPLARQGLIRTSKKPLK